MHHNYPRLGPYPRLDPQVRHIAYNFPVQSASAALGRLVRDQVSAMAHHYARAGAHVESFGPDMLVIHIPDDAPFPLVPCDA